MIFETKRLVVRKLLMTDLMAFHEMQSNPKVMQYVQGDVKTLDEHQKELKYVISKYKEEGNHFWIYAIILKECNQFLGTVALVKDGTTDEIGYRFLEKYWGKGYGNELVEGLIKFCKNQKFNNLTAYVINENKASSKILERNQFKKIKSFTDKDNFFVHQYVLEL